MYRISTPGADFQLQNLTLQVKAKKCEEPFLSVVVKSSRGHTQCQLNKSSYMDCQFQCSCDGNGCEQVLIDGTGQRFNDNLLCEVIILEYY